jgi:hypothetical protein
MSQEPLGWYLSIPFYFQVWRESSLQIAGSAGDSSFVRLLEEVVGRHLY